MTRPAAVAAAVLLCVVVASGAPAQDAPVVRDVVVRGAHELSTDDILDAARVARGRPLPVPVDRVDELADRVLHAYKDDGFTFATVTAAFDESSGLLTLTIDEGVIGAVEFTGVDDRLRAIFAEQFALRAGDVFNRSRARQALDVLLEPTRGAVRPGRVFVNGTTFTDSRQLGRRTRDRRGTFDLVDRNGEKVLLVGLKESAGRFRMVPDLGEREDWFTPVDGFVPSLGFGAAVFDHEHFNHAYVAGHLSIKTAGSAGYALGFEKPLFAARKLFVGGELHDLTTSDDQWQVSSLEASLAAIGPRRSLRDYYQRKGVQINAAFRPRSRIEIVGAWRGEHHDALGVESDFSFWNRDEPFRPNRPARSGHLSAVVLGASIDGDGFARESLDASYRRHQLDTLFGARLDPPAKSHDQTPHWRIDWTSEISAPDAFGSDFDFSRHIVNARLRKALSPHQDFGARLMRGWSGGILPPQRLFAIGGIGSVHGYPFQSEIGSAMTLVNLEYLLGWRDGLHVLGFYDAGRIESAPWLKGVGWGIGLGDFRVEVGYPTNDVPHTARVLVRFGRSF